MYSKDKGCTSGTRDGKRPMENKDTTREVDRPEMETQAPKVNRPERETQALEVGADAPFMTIPPS